MNLQGSTSPDTRYRPIDWTAWFLWITVCAAEPVFYTAASTASNKRVLPTDPHAGLIMCFVVVVLFAPVVLPVLQWIALRRIAPRLSLAFWFVGFLAAWFTWAVLALLPYGRTSAAESLFDQARRFSIALIGSQEPMTARQLLALPWGPLLLAALASGVAACAAPAWILARALGGRWYQILVAALAGACAAAVVDQLYTIYGPYRPFEPIVAYPLNGLSWVDRVSDLSLRAGAGAVWGAASALVFAVFSRRSRAPIAPAERPWPSFRPIGLAGLTIGLVLVAILPPVASYLLGPQGIGAGAPALRKALTFAPWHDRSEGEAVLTYTHDAAVSVSRFPSVVFAPDGKSFLTLTKDRTFVRIDAETGQSLGPAFGGKLGPYEHHAELWGPDGRFILLRSDGPEVKVSQNNARHQTRVRVFALPDQRLVGEFVNRDGECFDSYAHNPMLFEPDSNDIWLACEQYYSPKANDVMAIKLAVPSQAVREVRRFGDSAQSGTIVGLERVGGSVWAWQFGNDGGFRLRDLTRDQELLVLTNLTAPNLAGKLTAQPWTTVDEKHVSLSFCGDRSAVSDATVAPHTDWFCRNLIFDVRTGVLLERLDQVANGRWGLQVTRDEPAGLSIETTDPADSKTGDVIVRDLATNRQRQRIVSVVQQPRGWSPDGRWLVMWARDQDALRIYRVTP